MTVSERQRTCAVDDCDRAPQARGWCKMHWRRWRKHGDPSIVAKARQEKSPCQVDGCPASAHADGHCEAHLYRLRRYGDPEAQGVGRGVRPLIPNPTYDAVHKRLSRIKGPATRFTCVTCGRPAQEWSYNGGCPDEMRQSAAPGLAYSADLDFYAPRCKKCHRAMDESLNRGRNAAGQWCADLAKPGVDITIWKADEDI